MGVGAPVWKVGWPDLCLLGRRNQCNGYAHFFTTLLFSTQFLHAHTFLKQRRLGQRSAILFIKTVSLRRHREVQLSYHGEAKSESMYLSQMLSRDYKTVWFLNPIRGDRRLKYGCFFGKSSNGLDPSPRPFFEITLCFFFFS